MTRRGRALLVLLFALFMSHEQPAFATHESPTCIFSVSIVSTATEFQIVEEMLPFSCPAAYEIETAKEDGAWLIVHSQKYAITIKLPADLKSGYVMYRMGQGYATYTDWDSETRLQVLIFLEEWL